VTGRSIDVNACAGLSVILRLRRRFILADGKYCREPSAGTANHYFDDATRMVVQIGMATGAKAFPDRRCRPAYFVSACCYREESEMLVRTRSLGVMSTVFRTPALIE